MALARLTGTHWLPGTIPGTSALSGLRQDELEFVGSGAKSRTSDPVGMKDAMTGVTDGIMSGYDGTPGSTDAARWAAREAWARDTTLTVCTSRPYSPASKIEAASARQGRLPGSRGRQRRLGTAGRVLRGARGPPPAARSRRSSPQSGAFVHSTAVRTWRSGYTFDARRPPASGRRSGHASALAAAGTERGSWAAARTRPLAESRAAPDREGGVRRSRAVHEVPWTVSC